MLLTQDFWCKLATRMKLINADEWCPTLATDGKNFYYNSSFVLSLKSIDKVVFGFAHEVLHCIYDHIARTGGRDKKISNIAQDYIVNNLLIRDRIGTEPTLVDCFKDPKYAGWTSEEVYEELFKQAEKNGKEFLESLGSMLDEHLDLDGEGEGEGKDGKGKGRPKYSKDEMQKIRDEIKEGMLQAAQAAGAGNTPGEIARMIKELTEPKMNWRELLRQQIQSTIKHDFTFSRPSRKGWHTGAVLPGQQYDETIDIAISLDMSGSIGDDQAKDFLSEIKGIMDEYKDYQIKLWCFDTKVYNEQDFSADTGDDLLAYEIMGGGGTDFMANWKYMKDHDINPKKFIMFTDGYPWDSWGEDDYCDTIFIVHGHHDKNLQAPFGMTAHYEK
jgi:predicted metal-dependent peptidase